MFKDIPEPFNPRGIGLDYVDSCAVCGAVANVYPNISGFVQSAASGRYIVSLFKQGAKLDYRDYEPDWLQVKIGVCDDHKGSLERLYTETLSTKRITRKLIRDCGFPLGVTDQEMLAAIHAITEIGKFSRATTDERQKAMQTGHLPLEMTLRNITSE